MELGIGTAQFGLDYGVLNTQGRTPREEVRRILSFAIQHDIRMLDTAASYGTSEEVLGELAGNDHRFEIVTKLNPIERNDIRAEDADELEAGLHASLARLKRSSVYGLLVHRPSDLMLPGAECLVRRMQSLKQQGVIRKIGLSVYIAEEIDRCLQMFVPDLVQLPISAFDRRLLRSGHLAKLKGLGTEIHARSIFLQGLLLIDPQHFPPGFESHRMRLKSYRDALVEKGLTPLRAALGFIASIPEIDVAICGVNNVEQLQQIVSEYKNAADISDLPAVETDDPQILNPSNWLVQEH